MGAVDPRDALLGTMLGKDYLVEEEIGRGGMAVVYLVEHQTLLKKFAAKVLSTELAANAEARARFTQEAHAASQLDHENIVTISDFGSTADRRPFFVMELLRGATLDQRVAAGPMSLEEVVAVAVPVGRALAHAHAEGVVHRDVKPENIFLVQRSQGRWGVKVVDFGIAKAPINDRLTKMGQTLGSPMFMAPEACRGEEVDHRADIYSLGILLYLMLCGRVPFEDENLLKVLQMQVSSPLPPPREINPQLSPELAAAIEGALQKDPDARFQSMTELIDAFEAALPPGADRLLVEAQRGSTAALRTTPYPGVTRTSQPLPKVSSASGLPAQSATALATPRRSRTPLLVIAILSVVFAVGGVGFALLRNSKHEAPTTPADDPSAVPGAARDPATTPVPAGSATEHAAALPPRDVGGDGDRPPTPTPTIHLDIKSQPTRAEVTLDGKSLGRTPVSIDVPRQEREAAVTLELDGYREVKRTIDLRADNRFELALTEVPTKSSSSRSGKRKAKEPKPEPGRDSGSGTKPDPSLDIRTSR